MRYGLDPFPVVAFFGADGDADPGDVQENVTEGAEVSESSATPEPAEPKSGVDAETQAYIDKLKAENKGYRQRAQKAEGELKELSDAELSQMEKLTTRNSELESGLTASQAALREAHITNAVLRAANDLKFHDADDARGQLILDDIDFDDAGMPDFKQVRDQLKKVAEKKPYLVSTSNPGSGDGGPTGDPVQPPDQFQSKVDKYKQQYEERGAVPIPQ